MQSEYLFLSVSLPPPPPFLLEKQKQNSYTLIKVQDPTVIAHCKKLSIMQPNYITYEIDMHNTSMAGIIFFS